MKEFVFSTGFVLQTYTECSEAPPEVSMPLNLGVAITF